MLQGLNFLSFIMVICFFEVKKLRSHSDIIWDLDSGHKQNCIMIENRSWHRDLIPIWYLINHPLHFPSYLDLEFVKMSGIWNCINISSAISALDIIWFRVIGFATGISINLSNNVNFFPNKYCYLIKCFRCTLLSITL